jgi:hypothetical protein
MPSFRLRVRSTEIDLPLGELIIGRGTDCFLRVDDDLVSRRHARLEVTAAVVRFEDLGSRNGSRVNGEPALGLIDLKLGDTFEIGTQTFQVIRGGESNFATRTMLAHRACRACQLLMDAQAAVCPHCGAAQRPSIPTAPRTDPVATTGGEATPDTDEFDEPTRGYTEPQRAFESSFNLLSGLGDKLLSLGRIEEAERMIGPRLFDLLDRARAGEPLSDDVADQALQRALRLATATTHADWYRWIFDFARASRRRLGDPLLDELYANMLVHKPAAGESLRGYASAWLGEEPERAAHRKRLEALLRFCRE